MNEAALRAQLTSLKLSELLRRAIEAGATSCEIDESLNQENPRRAFIALIVLRLLPMSTIRYRAIEAGATSNEVDNAFDEEDPKAAFIALILVKLETQARKEEIALLLGPVEDHSCGLQDKRTQEANNDDQINQNTLGKLIDTFHIGGRVRASKDIVISSTLVVTAGSVGRVLRPDEKCVKEGRVHVRWDRRIDGRASRTRVFAESVENEASQVMQPWEDGEGRLQQFSKGGKYEI